MGIGDIFFAWLSTPSAKMTEILRERNKKFAKAIQTEYEAERVKTQSRYKHLVQERMGVEDMKNAGDKAVQGEAEPKTTADLLKSGDVLLADDTSVADDRLKSERPQPTWNYEEIEELIVDPGNPVPFAERLPYQAIENLKADPPKTKKFYRAHFAKQMANIIARAEELLGEEAQHLPEVRLGIEDFLQPEPAAATASVQMQQQQEEEEEDEWAGFSPAQRAIQETRQNVDQAWNAYRYVRSYTTLSDGLGYFTDDKMWPEKLGLAASKIEAEDAKSRLLSRSRRPTRRTKKPTSSSNSSWLENCSKKSSPMFEKLLELLETKLAEERRIGF